MTTDHEKILEIIRLKDQAPLVLARGKTALLVIDMQRYFVSPHYPLMQTFEKLVPGVSAAYCERVNASVIPNIKRLLDCFRGPTDAGYVHRHWYLPEGRSGFEFHVEGARSAQPGHDW